VHPCSLAAQMTRIIALMALITLGLSGAPVHEPVHASCRCVNASIAVERVSNRHAIAVIPPVAGLTGKRAA